MPSEQKWKAWLERLYNLRREKRGLHERPHKPVLLLSIIDHLDRGIVEENEFPLTDILIETFKQYFEVVRQNNDQPTIETPFYHLCGDGFWQVYSRNDQQPLYQPGNASSAPTMAKLRNCYGRFDDDLWHALLNDARARHQLREAIIARYFPEHHDRLAAIAGIKRIAPLKAIREEPPGRDAAFRRVVLEIYDFRCAACGIRVKINEALSLVEAAHVIPFSVSRNDRPDNGIALCPNHHWAMDRFLIFPCPDAINRCGIWRVGKQLDRRIDGQKELLALHEQPIIPPNEQKFYPAIESLRWRESHYIGRCDAP
jgi:putative restriction endonuclease